MFSRLPIKVGRFSASDSARFGRMVGPVGYFAVGPAVLLVNLPRRFVKADPIRSIFDLNKHLRERAQAAAQTAQD